MEFSERNGRFQDLIRAFICSGEGQSRECFMLEY